MLKVDLNKSLKEKKWSDFHNDASKKQPSQSIILKLKNFFSNEKFISKLGIPVLIVLLVFISTIFIALITTPRSFGFIRESEILANPALLGLTQEKDAVTESDKYFNQLLSIIGSSKQLDIRKITDLDQIRQTNPEAGEFYAEAKNGDVIFLMLDLNGAFILRPDEAKIVNFSRITLKEK